MGRGRRAAASGRPNGTTASATSRWLRRPGSSWRRCSHIAATATPPSTCCAGCAATRVTTDTGWPGSTCCSDSPTSPSPWGRPQRWSRRQTWCTGSACRRCVSGSTAGSARCAAGRGGWPRPATCCSGPPTRPMTSVHCCPRSSPAPPSCGTRPGPSTSWSLCTSTSSPTRPTRPSLPRSAPRDGRCWTWSARRRHLARPWRRCSTRRSRGCWTTRGSTPSAPPPRRSAGQVSATPT